MDPGAVPGDVEFIERAKGGDEQAFEALYRRHRDYVLAIAGRFGCRGEDALDVLQETFFHVLGILPRFQLTSRFTSYLYPVVKHLCLRRKQRLSRFFSLDDPRAGAATWTAPPDGAAGALAAGHMVSALPENQREIVLLRFVDGLRLEEIADLLKIPLGTVKSRLHQALKTLRHDRN